MRSKSCEVGDAKSELGTAAPNMRKYFLNGHAPGEDAQREHVRQEHRNVSQSVGSTAKRGIGHKEHVTQWHSEIRHAQERAKHHMGRLRERFLRRGAYGARNMRRRGMRLRRCATGEFEAGPCE